MNLKQVEEIYTKLINNKDVLTTLDTAKKTWAQAVQILLTCWIFFWRWLEAFSAFMLTFVGQPSTENGETSAKVTGPIESVERTVVERTIVDKPELPYETITDPKSGRYFLHPVQYTKIWDLYKKQMANFWTAEEIDFSNDIVDFEALAEAEKNVLKMVIALFVWADGVVNENISLNFINEITIPEAKYVYNFQEMMENIHNEVYSNMLDKLVRNEEEKEYLKDSIENIPSITAIYKWITDWMHSSSSIATRLLIFTYFEGVLFSGMFAIIFWFKKKGTMKGIIQANNWIARDEGLHYKTGCELYSLLENKLSAEEVHEYIARAVDVTVDFTNDVLKTELGDLNRKNMRKYIEYISDRLLHRLGYQKLYGTENPFDYMETIGLYSKENFFERRPTQYQHADVMNTDRSFGIEEDY